MKVTLLDLSAALVALASASTSVARPSHHSFNYATHLGNLSPYLKAPVPNGIQETLPEDCTVDQVMLVRLTVSISLFSFICVVTCDLGFLRLHGSAPTVIPLFAIYHLFRYFCRYFR